MFHTGLIIHTTSIHSLQWQHICLSQITSAIVVYHFSVHNNLELILVTDQSTLKTSDFSATTFNISFLSYLNEGVDECTWEERKRARGKVMEREWSREKREGLEMEVRWASWEGGHNKTFIAASKHIHTYPIYPHSTTTSPPLSILSILRKVRW